MIYKGSSVVGLKREAVAFANTDGGNIYVGIDDNGEIVDVENHS